MASSASRRMSASSTTERTAATCSAGTCASRSAMTAGPSPAAAAARSAWVSARPIARRSSSGMRPSAATRSSADIDHAQDLACWGQHRDVMDVALEHVEHDVAAQLAPGADRVGGLGHDGRDRLIRAEARRDHPRPQVTIGDDAERVPVPDQDGARPLGGHPLGRRADRFAARAQQRRPPDRLGYRRCPGSSGGGAVGGARRVTIDRATNRSTSGRASSGRTTSPGIR